MSLAPSAGDREASRVQACEMGPLVTQEPSVAPLSASGLDSSAKAPAAGAASAGRPVAAFPGLWKASRGAVALPPGGDRGGSRAPDGVLGPLLAREPSPEPDPAEANGFPGDPGLDSAGAEALTGGASAARPAAAFPECPCFGRAVRGCRAVSAVLVEVARHYDVDLCVLTWRDGGRLCFTAGAVASVSHAPLRATCEWSPYQLFNHTIGRELPVIIADVEQDDTYGRVDPAPFATSIRFYAAAPILCAPGAYAGTLCVVDSRRPRTDFCLSDAAFLREKAAELMESVRDFMS
mmetsp:Transcript_90740/g.256467  ORF Transcript_90740/g.256467 Transcript_90740/m.256467 type:complete len:293 (+) Transcript_90740:37-915(+)